MGLDGAGWGWMGLDGAGWGWMGLDGAGWGWYKLVVGSLTDCVKEGDRDDGNNVGAYAFTDCCRRRHTNTQTHKHTNTQTHKHEITANNDKPENIAHNDKQDLKHT